MLLNIQKIKDHDIITAEGCHNCPFFNNEICNLGAGNVVNEWRQEIYHDRCPLRDTAILVIGN